MTALRESAFSWSVSLVVVGPEFFEHGPVVFVSDYVLEPVAALGRQVIVGQAGDGDPRDGPLADMPAIGQLREGHPRLISFPFFELHNGLFLVVTSRAQKKAVPFVQV